MKLLLSRKRRGIAGSLTIEFVIVMPLYAVLWLSANWAYKLSIGVVSNMREVRECAWHYAGGGCRIPRGSCISTPFRPLPPAEAPASLFLRQVTLQFRAIPDLLLPYGMSYQTRRIETLPGVPMIATPTIPMSNAYTGICDEAPLPSTPMTVFIAHCRFMARFCF